MHTSVKAILLCALCTQLSAQETKEDWRLYKPVAPVEAQVDPLKPSKASTVDLAPVRSSTGEVRYFMDPRISEIDSIMKDHPKALEGFRVQVFFGSRSEAQKMRNEFVKKYPDTGAYLSYLAPNFRLRVGDFRTKLECEKFKAAVSKDFPGSYIVKDEIQMPELKTASAPVLE